MQTNVGNNLFERLRLLPWMIRWFVRFRLSRMSLH